MHSTPHVPRGRIAILIVMLGFLVSLGHAAETFSRHCEGTLPSETLGERGRL